MQTACTPNEYENVKLCLESIYCLACVLCFTARKKRMNRIECGGKVNECNIRTKNDINDKITAKTITAFVCMRLVIAKSMCVNARTIVFFRSMVWFGSVRVPLYIEKTYTCTQCDQFECRNTHTMQRRRIRNERNGME